MKTLLRQPAVRSAAAGAVAAYSRLAYRTIRFREEGHEAVMAARGEGQGVIVCFWHAGIPVSLVCWQRISAGMRDLRALVSRSNDGALVADVVTRLGAPAIRGSRAIEPGRSREKGGAEAMREMVRYVQGGGALAMTPDGPKGPPRQLGEGAPLLARLSGAQVYLLGMASSPTIRLNSWDRAFLPLPFSRVAMVWDGPYLAGRAPLEDLARDWQGALDRVTTRAEALTR